MAGLKTSGKSTASKILVDEYGFRRVAFADRLKELVYEENPQIYMMGGFQRLQEMVDNHGWDKAKKYAEVRQTLQRVGVAHRKLFGDDFWIDQLEQEYPDLWRANTRYVLDDARFENEGTWIKDFEGNRTADSRSKVKSVATYWAAPVGTLIWVDRPGVESDGHSSESNDLERMADYKIVNDSTKEVLETAVRMVMDTLGISN